MYLYGKNPILERLKVNPKSIKKIFIEKSFDSPNILDLIKKSTNIPVKRVTETELSRIKRAVEYSSTIESLWERLL